MSKTSNPFTQAIRDVAAATGSNKANNNAGLYQEPSTSKESDFGK